MRLNNLAGLFSIVDCNVKQIKCRTYEYTGIYLFLFYVCLCFGCQGRAIFRIVRGVSASLTLWTDSPNKFKATTPVVTSLILPRRTTMPIYVHILSQTMAQHTYFPGREFSPFRLQNYPIHCSNTLGRFLCFDWRFLTQPAL